MADISKEEEELMSKVEDIVCKHFSVELGKIVSRNITNKVVIARNFLFHILHADLGISVSKIASSYFRGERNVKYRLADMKVCVSMNGEYRDIHAALVEKIRRRGIDI